MHHDFWRRHNEFKEIAIFKFKTSFPMISQLPVLLVESDVICFLTTSEVQGVVLAEQFFKGLGTFNCDGFIRLPDAAVQLNRENNYVFDFLAQALRKGTRCDLIFK